MRYIKSINEFFDSDELKSELEIPFLQGELSFKDMVKDKNFFKQKDLLLSKLLMNCPFIGGLKYSRLSSSLIQIGYQHDIVFEGNNIVVFYVIEVMEHASSQTYLCNIYSKCIKNGNKVLFDEKITKQVNYNGLYKLINNEGLDMLIKFTNFSEKEFNYKYFPYTNRKDILKIQGPVNNN